jgi:hypothetical protein
MRGAGDNGNLVPDNVLFSSISRTDLKNIYIFPSGLLLAALFLFSSGRTLAFSLDATALLG